MALPTQKTSKSRKRVKQYKNRLKKKTLSVCPKCKKPVLPHHVCRFCGTYINKEVIKPKKDKKERAKEKEKKEKELSKKGKAKT